jgi:hypothetical protein
MKIGALVSAAIGYVRENPQEIVKAAINATGLRFGVPLAALRWGAKQLKPGKKTPQDIEIGSSPPALRLSAIVDAMGTSVRASAAVKVDEVELSADALRVGVQLRDVKLALVGDADTPVATLIKSGALDLSKPGNLVKFIPKRPAAIVEADGDRIVVDLMKVQKIAGNKALRRVLSVVIPVLNVRAIETDRDHLYVALKASPSGIARAIEAIRSET